MKKSKSQLLMSIDQKTASDPPFANVFPRSESNLETGSKVLRLDFYRANDKESTHFCNIALELILKWSELPEKTKQTLKFHMEEEDSVNEDIGTMIRIVREDVFLIKCSPIVLLGNLLIDIIKQGDYDSRYRVLLRHIAALLGILWDDFEQIENNLSNEIINDFIESESSKETREKSQRVKRWKRMAYIGAAGGLGAVLIGLTSGLAAPLVASGIGAITTSGAIAGLATSTGAAIFGSIFGVAGGSLAGYRMKKRVGAIEEFEVESLTNSKCASLHCVLAISGWIEENDSGAFSRQWRHLWMSNDQFTLRYESKYLEEWGKAMDYFVSMVVGYAIQRSLMETILAGVVSAIAWPMVLISSSSIIDNPWNVCFSRSAEVGEHLAEILLTRAHGRRPITLIGFSLGARVIYHCLLAMSKRGGLAIGIVEDVILLGAPVSASPAQWNELCNVVGGRIINGYCTTDWLLRFLYRTASIQFTIAGTGPVYNKNERKIVNFNLSHIIKGHSEYAKKLTQVLDAVGVKVTPLSQASRQDLEVFCNKESPDATTLSLDNRLDLSDQNLSSDSCIKKSDESESPQTPNNNNAPNISNIASALNSQQTESDSEMKQGRVNPFLHSVC